MIKDTDGNIITSRPDYSKGCLLQADNGDLIYTEYTAEQIADMSQPTEPDRISAVEDAIAAIMEAQNV